MIIYVHFFNLHHLSMVLIVMNGIKIEEYNFELTLLKYNSIMIMSYIRAYRLKIDSKCKFL